MIGAVIVLLLGVAGIVLGFFAKHHKDAMAATATVGCVDVAAVAGGDEPVPCEVVGTAEPAKAPLTGPFSGTPCVWYRAEVSRRYKERKRDSRGNYRTVTSTEKVSEQSSAEPFGVRDVSGAVWVFPDGANVIGETRTVDRFDPYVPPQQEVPTSGSFAEKALAVGMNFLTRSTEDTIGYNYEEWVLRAGTTVYVRGGAARDHAGSAWLQRPANGPFLISTRSEADLSRKAGLAMYGGFGLGAAALLGGLVWTAAVLLA
jgi:hypothetical protein